MSDAPLGSAEHLRPLIELSWTRSRGHGVREDAAPALVQTPVDTEDRLRRAAEPVLEKARSDVDGFPAVLLLADRTARVLDTRHTDALIGDAIADLGITPGVLVEEEQVGTNGLGTTLETGQGVHVRGTEHYMRVFDPFSCFGQPIVHPVTGRIEGVVNIGCHAGAEHPLLPSLARHLARDIEDRLRQDSPLAQRRLLAAFQAAARLRGRAVVVLGPGLVLANPAALDLLQPADHPALQAYAGTLGSTHERTHRLTLSSGPLGPAHLHDDRRHRTACSSTSSRNAAAGAAGPAPTRAASGPCSSSGNPAAAGPPRRGGRRAPSPPSWTRRRSPGGVRPPGPRPSEHCWRRTDRRSSWRTSSSCPSG
ncbi:sigma factor [Streptomyces sp. e14]|nr:sigma factor [Streptomyces sp. e14]